jgi:hypothetical protein
MKIKEIYLCTDGVDGNYVKDEDNNFWIDNHIADNLDCKCLLDLTEEQMKDNGNSLEDCSHIIKCNSKEGCASYLKFLILLKLPKLI